MAVEMGDDPRFIFAVWALIILFCLGTIWWSLTSSFPWVP